MSVIKDTVERYMTRNRRKIDQNNVLRVLAIAETHNSSNIMRLALNYLVRNCKDISKLEGLETYIK